ncbi:hypothetical protein HO133_001475 [Letharia lupina]|uniref:Uncharacterized protein n=1 Tax=Letharia lupina TaxID=560253 RepID=A0A8H6CF92_9LECA|nr:uncharacterized protein HO133_001475 [Letharia lupina]KAF6222389.1 hypothetical protein HO133_001475 [Letharia lupina]
MTDLQSSQHPLKVLSSSLVLVLHQTGKILRDPNQRNPRQSGLTQKRISEYVPWANQQFHDALDEIEVEILQAKAVMERDLSLLRKKRVERERIANGLKAQPSPEEATGIPQLSEIGPSETSLAKDTTPNPGEGKREDTIMVDSALEAGLIGPNDEPQAEGPQNKDNDKNITSDPGMPQDAENSMGLAITMPQDSTAETAEPPKSPEMKFSGATPAAEAPLDSSAADLDFESMFNDTDLTGGDDTMNFGLDFASDGNLNQDVLNDSAFEKFEMSNADMSNLGATTSEDINTLLPGLENYVNAGTDFSNINIPVASTLPETSQVAPVGTVGAPAQMSAQPVVVDSSFDDIFGSGDYSMDGTGDDGMGAGTLGDFEDFDEDWFKTDQT